MRKVRSKRIISHRAVLVRSFACELLTDQCWCSCVKVEDPGPDLDPSAAPGPDSWRDGGSVIGPISDTKLTFCQSTRLFRKFNQMQQETHL